MDIKVVRVNVKNTNNDPQSFTQKIKDRVLRSPQYNDNKTTTNQRNHIITIVVLISVL
jgi:hypothetical protein